MDEKISKTTSNFLSAPKPTRYVLWRFLLTLTALTAIGSLVTKDPPKVDPESLKVLEISLRDSKTQAPIKKGNILVLSSNNRFLNSSPNSPLNSLKKSTGIEKKFPLENLNTQGSLRIPIEQPYPWNPQLPNHPIELVLDSPNYDLQNYTLRSSDTKEKKSIDGKSNSSWEKLVVPREYPFNPNNVAEIKIEVIK